jgi:hypothetical protein
LDVSANGSIKLNFPDIDPDQLFPSCALDVAEQGEHSLWSVAPMLNLTGERCRQIIERALQKLRDKRCHVLPKQGC